MASTTPNIGLTLPTGAEKVSRQVINANNTIIDSKIGAVPGGQNLQGEIDALNGNITTINQNIANVELTLYKEWSSNISIHAVKIGHLVHVSGWVLLNAIEYNSTRPCLVINGAIPFYDNSYVFDNEGTVYILKKASTRSELYFNETTTVSAQKYVFFNFTYIV